jgi:hypothetical protein
MLVPSSFFSSYLGNISRSSSITGKEKKEHTYIQTSPKKQSQKLRQKNREIEQREKEEEKGQKWREKERERERERERETEREREIIYDIVTSINKVQGPYSNTLSFSMN